MNYAVRSQAFSDELQKMAESELLRQGKRIGTYGLGFGAGVGTVGLGHYALSNIPKTREWYRKLSPSSKMKMWGAVGAASGAGVLLLNAIAQAQRRHEFARIEEKYRDRAKR